MYTKFEIKSNLTQKITHESTKIDEYDNASFPLVHDLSG